MKSEIRKQAEIMLSDDIANGEVPKNISREEKERIIRSYEKWLNERPYSPNRASSFINV